MQRDGLVVLAVGVQRHARLGSQKGLFVQACDYGCVVQERARAWPLQRVGTLYDGLCSMGVLQHDPMPTLALPEYAYKLLVVVHVALVQLCQHCCSAGPENEHVTLKLKLAVISTDTKLMTMDYCHMPHLCPSGCLKPGVGTNYRALELVTPSLMASHSSNSRNKPLSNGQLKLKRDSGTD